jgi:hypothetical protein
MKKSPAQMLCSLCDKPVTLREDTCADKNGKAVHSDCHAQQILQGEQSQSKTAA